MTHRDGSAGSKIRCFLGGLVQFGWQVLRHRPDLVHLHMSADGSFVRKAALFWIARLARIPVLLHMHSGLFQLFYDRMPVPVRKLITSTLEHAAVVVALGEDWADRLRDIAPAASIVVVPNAVSVREPSRQPAAGESVHVVFLGQICDAKGVFVLLEAWAKVIANCPAGQARLTIAGSGETERAHAEVSRLGIEGTVEIRSWLTPDDVQALLASAQVLTLPSMNEGQPMAVLEAMASGLCVVATAVGGLPELVADGESGLLMPAGDVDALAEALRTVLLDDAQRSAFGAAGRRRVQAEFDAQVVWRRFDQLYRVMARRR